jgi:3-methylfumaryl-CoA hydratase
MVGWPVNGLAGHLEGWWPEPLRRTDQIRQWPMDAFAGLLDQPVLAPDASLPPLWHWFSFLDHPAQNEIGTDGHPADGHFLPPIPHRRRMFAGGRWQRIAGLLPLRIGDEVTSESTVTSIQPKTGRSGEMAFVTVRNEFSLGGELAAVEEQDIVYRSEPPVEPEATPALGAPTTRAQPGSAPSPQPEAVESAEHELRIDADPPMLFRYSALTYNTHRIHYDQPYATGVEGYPGLVVHGPLIATLLLDLLRRHRPATDVKEYRFRALKPLYDTATFHTCGMPDEDRRTARLWTRDAEGARTMEATAGW